MCIAQTTDYKLEGLMLISGDFDRGY